MRTVTDPYGGVSPMIDKMIGNAYEIVRYVARYLKEIRYVAENMESIYAVAKGTVRGQLLLEATATATTSLALPEDFEVQDIEALSVIAITEDDKVYGPATNTFSYVLTGGNVVVTLVGSPPAGVLGGKIKCLITYQPAPVETA